MMIDYKENLINENSELNQYDPITKLMKYRMLSNEEMIDRDRCECAYRAYKKLNWLNDNNKDLEPDTFFSSPYYYIKEMCRKYDIENNNNYYFNGRSKMNNKAFYNLTYGVFLLAAKAEEKANACIVNTGVQVAGSPVRVAVSVLNTNYTCALIKESGRFTLSALDDSCSFETIKHFGMQSGRDVDKLDSLPMPTDESGVPYLNWSTCARFSGKVTHSVDLGTHTLFIAEVTEAEVCSDRAPLTYADYQNKLKPKSEKVERERKIVGWRCKICGYVYEGSALPEDYACPLCGHGTDDFEPVYEE